MAEHFCAYSVIAVAPVQGSDSVTSDSVGGSAVWVDSAAVAEQKYAVAVRVHHSEFAAVLAVLLAAAAGTAVAVVTKDLRAGAKSCSDAAAALVGTIVHVHYSDTLAHRDSD